MNFDRDPSNTDEYFLTALQIFDCCSVERSSSLRVDALMDKFAPFVKTNKGEFSYLKALLDPEQSNPNINVTKLANALHKYSETQKTKVDLDESFNLKCGAPQDSDSGISSDGLQLLEELQCELKEKEHLAHQLRSQLDFTDRQHEEALAAMTAERDSLRRHLNIVREENATLTQVRRDYEEACERLCASETALDDTKRELDLVKKRGRIYHEQVAVLESDKSTLQELLSKSKDECHRINEMYASRQSALLEENETLKNEHADLTARLQDQEEFMQQVIKDKVLLEMELKDVLNKSNQTHLRLDRSIDVSYTEDQMLTALDSLNADTRFGPEHRLLDEESFMSMFKEDGRASNMSLFDEIRLSFCKTPRHSMLDCDAMNRSLSNNSFVSFGTQTHEDLGDMKAHDYTELIAVQTQTENDSLSLKKAITVETQTDNEPIPNIDCNTIVSLKEKQSIDIETQTDERNKTESRDQNTEHISTNNQLTQTLGVILKNRPLPKKNKVQYPKPKIGKAVQTQTEVSELLNMNNNAMTSMCFECGDSNFATKLQRNVNYSNVVLAEAQVEIAKYEENLVYLQRLIVEEHDKNILLHCVVEDLNTKMRILEDACDKQRELIGNILEPEVCCVDCQTQFDQSTVSTQADVPCVECVKRTAVMPHRNLRRFFWDPIKCLFQVFAVICFLGAVYVLMGVARRAGGCRVAPWRWMHAQDIMDLLLRIEYTAEVPM